MDHNTIAYRWARFQNVLRGLELTDPDWCDDIDAQDDSVAQLQDQAFRTPSIVEATNHEGLSNRL